VTMAPDPHTPHPTRPFEDPYRDSRNQFDQRASDVRSEDPPAYRHVAVAKKALRGLPVGEPPRRSTWRATAFAVVWIVLEVATFLAALAAVCLAILLLAGDVRTINAWGLWFRAIIGG